MAPRAKDSSYPMGGICAAAASSPADREGSGISEGLGERAGILWPGSKVKHSAREGRAEMANKACRRASERRIKTLGYIQCRAAQYLDELASKLNYESVGRSRLS